MIIDKQVKFAGRDCTASFCLHLESMLLPIAIPLSEYRRMVDEVPVLLAQTLTAHDDEVLHVSFSHDGKQISSCSKDHHVIIWNRSEVDGHFAEHYRRDMAQCGWMHTWASQYNPSDTKLLVSGVVNAVGGEVAIFSTGRGTTERYEFLCRMVNDPYDFLGCWCSDDYVISGTMIGDAENRFISSVWLCKTESDEAATMEQQDPLTATHLVPPTFPAHLNMSNYLALLFKFVNLAVGCSKSGKLLNSCVS